MFRKADKTIRIWDWGNAICEQIIPAHEAWVKSLCQLPNDDIVSGSDDKTIKIWSNYQQLNILSEHTESVKCLCNIDNRYIASGSFDNTIKIWDLNENRCVQTLNGHNDKVICLSFET